MPEPTEGVFPAMHFDTKHQTVVAALKGSGNMIDLVLTSYIQSNNKDAVQMAEHIRTSLESKGINLQNYRVEVKDISTTENNRLYPGYQVSFSETETAEKPVYTIFCDFPELAREVS